MQVWVNNSQLPGDHAVAGSFETAARVGGRPLMFWNTQCLCALSYHEVGLLLSIHYTSAYLYKIL